jgi:hypothetical protein
MQSGRGCWGFSKFGSATAGWIEWVSGKVAVSLINKLASLALSRKSAIEALLEVAKHE